MKRLLLTLVFLLILSGVLIFQHVGQDVDTVENEVNLDYKIEMLSMLEMIDGFEDVGQTEEIDDIEEQTEQNNINEIDLYWMARIISAESKGEPQQGQIAVGNVVLNRVYSNEFPNTIEEVIFQNGQFCPVRNGSIHNEPTERAIESAKMVLMNERVLSIDVLFFYNPNVVSRGNWIRTRPVERQIGRHNFAK